ncbi:phage major capsid protein [Clostridium perfringens]
MKKIDELKNKFNQVKGEAETLKAENKITEALAKVEEAKNIKAQIKLEEELENTQLDDIKDKIEKGDVKNMKEKDSKNSKFVNYLRGTISSEDEKKLFTEAKNSMNEGNKADGGALVPYDEDCSIITLREADDALQNLITVKPVTTLSGKKTIRLRKTGGTNFKLVGENKSIGIGSTPSYKELEYSCKKYASIYDITNEFESDSETDVIKELNHWIGSDSRELRNILIIDELSKKEVTPIQTIDDIKQVKNVTLNTANSAYARILTNQDGYNYLDKMKDENGNYLLQPCITEKGKYMIDGLIIDVKDNSIIPSKEGKAPIFIGDFKMSVILFDRQDVTVKVTTDGGDAFDKDLTLLRAIEREDIQTLDDEAFVHGEIDTTIDPNTIQNKVVTPKSK